MSKFILFMLIALCVLFIGSYTNRSAKRAQVDEQIRQWETRIEREKQKQVALQAELDYIASPDYLDKVAREELNLHKEGDTVIVVLPGKAAQPATRASGGQTSAAGDGLTPSEGEIRTQGQRQSSVGEQVGEPTGEPIWQQWLTLFSADSDRS